MSLMVFEKFVDILNKDGVFTSDYLKDFIPQMQKTGFFVFDHKLNLSDKSLTVTEESVNDINKLPESYNWFECKGGILLTYNNESSKPSAIVGLLVQEANGTYNGYMLGCELQIEKEKQYLLEDTLKIITFTYDKNGESFNNKANKTLHNCIHTHLNAFFEQKETIESGTLTLRVGKTKKRLDLSKIYKVNKI